MKVLRSAFKRKAIDNLHSSITAPRFAPSTRTQCSSTFTDLCNTHRSGLLRYAASLARTPGVPHPHAVNRTALSVAWKSPISLRTVIMRTRLASVRQRRFGLPLLNQISSTARLGTASKCGPVVKTTIMPWV